MQVGVKLSHRNICRGNLPFHKKDHFKCHPLHTLEDLQSTPFAAPTLRQRLLPHLCSLHALLHVYAGVNLHLWTVAVTSKCVCICKDPAESIHWGNRREIFFFSSSCTSFPSLIRTHSVNQAWIPNTITCKVLCLCVIGLASAVFLKRLASLAFPSLQPGVPAWEMQLADDGWSYEGEIENSEKKDLKDQNSWVSMDHEKHVGFSAWAYSQTCMGIVSSQAKNLPVTLVSNDHNKPVNVNIEETVHKWVMGDTADWHPSQNPPAHCAVTPLIKQTLSVQSTMGSLVQGNVILVCMLEAYFCITCWHWQHTIAEIRKNDWLWIRARHQSIAVRLWGGR